MKTTSSVKRWGNSLAIRIPAAVAQSLQLTENSTIQIVSDGTIATLQLQKSKPVTLDELIVGITSQNVHGEVEWGGSVGKEVW